MLYLHGVQDMLVEGLVTLALLHCTQRACQRIHVIANYCPLPYDKDLCLDMALQLCIPLDLEEAFC
mgnify:CR=1 FL=1